MKKLLRWLCVLLPIAVLLLGLLPEALVLRFADPTSGSHDVYVSYYSMLPPGYGNWGPILTLILSLVLAGLGIVNALRDDLGRRRWMLIAAVVTVMASLISVLFGSMTMIGGTITALLIVECVVCWYLAYK